MKVLIFSLMLILSDAFAARGVDGGGGVGILCGQTVTTLDLFEAKKNGLELLPSTGSLSEELYKFGDLVKAYVSTSRPSTDSYWPKVPNTIPMMFRNVTDGFKDILPGRRLPFTDDATLPTLPTGCSFVQLVVQQDTQSFPRNLVVLRDRDLWDRLSEQDQAALIVHEYLYRRAREQGEISSDETRKIVGLIFSKESIEPVFKPIWDLNSKLVCMALRDWSAEDPEIGSTQQDYQFFAYNDIVDGKSGLRITFDEFRTIYVNSRTLAFLPGISVEGLLKDPLSSPVHSVDVVNLLRQQTSQLDLEFQEKISAHKFRFKIHASSTDDLFAFTPTKGTCQLRF